MGILQVSPEVLIAASVELDTLALRMETAIATTSPSLTPVPAGSEEVSIHAAAYFHTLASSFAPAAAQAIAELRATAQTLRQQASSYVGQDFSSGNTLSSIM